MKKVLIFNLLALVFFSCNFSSNEQKNEVTVKYDIVFADGFDNDEIIFSVNGDNIIKTTINSDKTVGLTNLGYQIIQKGNNTILINKYENEKEHIINKKQELELSIFFDKEWYSIKPQENL